MEQQKNLIYLGPGWDNKFLQFMPDYDNYILYDALPKIPHYIPGQPGYRHTRNPYVFKKRLVKAFGPIIPHHHSRKTWYFDNNVEYHYSCDVELLNRLPPGDILLRGYHPDDNHKLLESRRIFVSCDTYYDLPYEHEPICFHEPDISCADFNSCSSSDEC